MTLLAPFLAGAGGALVMLFALAWFNVRFPVAPWIISRLGDQVRADAFAAGAIGTRISNPDTQPSASGTQSPELAQ
ncbi:MAG TPA: hypothetical protein DHW63_05950 [Hyphomonadaceae bacterium]|nr:hypothetical protein [Hyphomonadaceae bacterium]